MSEPSRVGAVCGFAVLLTEVLSYHLGLALFVAAVAAMVFRLRLSAAVLAGLGLVLAGPALLSFARAAPELPVAPASCFTVLTCNTLFMQADLDVVESIVREERPDVVIFQEVWADRAEEITRRFAADYPNSVAPSSSRWGCVVLSRAPFVGDVGAIPGPSVWPIDQPTVIVDYEGRRVEVVGVHLPSPMQLERSAAAPAMAVAVAEWVGARGVGPGAPDAIVLAGDFNAPITTGRMAPLREAGLAEAQATAGRGRGATWPDRTPLRFFPGTRLDQIAFTDGLRCVESRVMGSTGSDHRPTLARFVWK
ncbi:MAG: endonuclease/exonuclease/phosphatase family protein [Phycisphaeraceae bacterium]|nr:MAG: endonuclease/exonuclease/phosphatase family protein [Phycisphaeraceae bacterium]